MKKQYYFLGGTSPEGFVTHFGNVISDTDYRTYIIKGGPGTGKSSMMKKISAAFPDEEQDIFHCSSDPDSIDAVVLRNRRVVFVDGTAPHTFDPEYPGAVQQLVDLGSCWNSMLLRKNKPEIISSTSEYLQHHKRCRRYVTALSSVAGDTMQVGSLALNTEKLDGFTERLAKKILPRKQDSNKGMIEYRQLSALTPKGYLTNIPKDYEIYLLNDNMFAGSEAFLRKFSELAALKGYDVYVSVSTILNNSFEHIIIPELKTAFLSANPINEIGIEQKKPVNFKRFYDKNILRDRKNRLKFNEGAVKNLRDEAVSSLVNAKTAHDKLEGYYVRAVDFSEADRICDELIAEIKKIKA